MTQGRNCPRPLAALREATRRTLGAWKSHVVYGAVVAAIAGFLLAPAASWILVQALGAAAGGSVVNFNIADLALSLRGLGLLVLWSLLAGVIVVISAAGHAYLAAAGGLGLRPRVLTVLRYVAADLPRVPGRGGLRIALLAALGLPLIGAAAAAVAGLLLLPLGTGHELRDVVPRGLPVPVWMVGLGMALLFVLFAWLYVRWSLAIAGLTLEGATLTKATRRSAKRVRGAFWRIAGAHLLHHVGVTLLFAILVGLLRLVGRPVVAMLVERSPDAAPIALAGLMVVFYVLSGALWVLGTARMVTLTVVHHLALGGGLRRATSLETPRDVRRFRLGATVLAFGTLATFTLATWLTIPRVDEELGRAARSTTVTAHRGSSVAAPENTLAALRQAIEDRADFAEIDVQQAKDGTIVVVHDGNLKRLAGVDANVWEMDYEALSRLDVGSRHSNAFAGERIPRLEQALDAARDRIRLNIELKTNGHENDAFVPDVVALLREEDFIDRCIVTSLEIPFLRRLRQIEPKLRIGAIITAKVGTGSDLDVDLYSVQPLIATSAFIRRAHSEGRQVHVWTVNDRGDMERFADRAADSLITDAPRLAREVLDARTAADGMRGAARRLFGLD
jgi:glycerophosphoryl diester phosphodiesterase